MIVVRSSITTLPPEAKGAVLITGSHGGLISAYLAGISGAKAVIFNDAGVGLDEAGIAGLKLLDKIGMPAAAISHLSARIGDGHDSAARGLVTYVNETAMALGARPGQKCKHVAKIFLRKGETPHNLPDPFGPMRHMLSSTPPEIWAIDSVGRVQASDAGKALIIGSHGALHSGRADTALPVKAALAVFNDAGGGVDGAGYTRLPALAQQGIAAVTVGHTSARIGNARSSWESGIISRTNSLARSYGAREGLRMSDWVRGTLGYHIH
jgi:hypothetical protein